VSEPLIERSLRFRASGFVKSLVSRAYGLPFSRHGLDVGLVPFLPEGRPVALIDVGASAGDFTAVVTEHCGIARALLAEPMPARCRQLEARYPDPRFVIRQCAVSDSAGTTHFDILNADYSSSILPALPAVGGSGQRLDLRVKERIAVELRTLDELVPGAGLDGAIDLLKIDTQGAELHVLRGATAILPRVRLIWVEVSFRALYEGSALFADVHAFLSTQGFRFYSIHEGFRGVDGELLQADVLFLGAGVPAKMS
jgi:FkbM family methyltransferase